MTRRILFMLLGFTAIILVGAVVPLTLNATTHDRNSFTQAAADQDQADAAIAQAALDGQPDQPLLALITQTRQGGDGLLVMATAATDPRMTHSARISLSSDWVDLARITVPTSGPLPRW